MFSRLSPSIGLDLAAAYSEDRLRHSRERAQAASIRRTKITDLLRGRKR